MKPLLKALFILALPIVAGGIYFSLYLNTPAAPTEIHLTIHKGMSLRSISERLEEQGVIQNHLLFLIYAKILGQSKNLKAGEYLFASPRTPRQVLISIVNGEVLAYKVQILEGWNLRQIAAHLETLSFIPDSRSFSKRFMELATDKNFMQTLGLNLNSLEGYLFPETYFFTKQTPPEEFLATFVTEFKKRYFTLLEKTPNTGSLSQHEIVTLASLIEKETGQGSERKIIASVFFNRLRKKMLLQSDPTTIYGLANFDGNIRKRDLKNQHPYNTYIHPGLPPGPICNPSIASIGAVLRPAHTDYLFFVSKNDGTHFFSRNMSEHSEAIRIFQLERKTAEESRAQQTHQTNQPL